jgi:hypothetical protein
MNSTEWKLGGLTRCCCVHRVGDYKSGEEEEEDDDDDDDEDNEESFNAQGGRE